MEKYFFKKTPEKSLQLVYADQISKTLLGNFLKLNGFKDMYVIFGDFTVLKNYSSPKNINKTQMTKTLKNFANDFGQNCLTNYLTKRLQDRIKP